VPHEVSRPSLRSGKPRRVVAFALLTAALFVAVTILSQATQAGVVDDGTISLGIQNRGDLTVASGGGANCGWGWTLSIRKDSTNQEGMDCDLEGEGWGAAYDIGMPTVMSCWASSGSLSGAPLSTPPPIVTSFTSTPSTATSIVQCTSIQITQHYNPYPGHPNVYKDDISIVNTGLTTVHGLSYRRAMAWGSFSSASDFTFEDIATWPAGSLTPSVVSMTGVVEGSTSLDPTTTPLYLAVGPPGPPVFHYFLDLAMVWNFNFGDFGPGYTQNFTLYYGMDDSTLAAQATLTAINAQVYNFAYPQGTTPTAEGPIGIMAFGNLGIRPPSSRTPSRAAARTPSTSRTPARPATGTARQRPSCRGAGTSATAAQAPWRRTRRTLTPRKATTSSRKPSWTTMANPACTR